MTHCGRSVGSSGKTCCQHSSLLREIDEYGADAKGTSDGDRDNFQPLTELHVLRNDDPKHIIPNHLDLE